MLSVSLKRVAYELYAQAGTDFVRRRCLRALKQGNVLDLVSMEISPRDYTDPHVFKRDYQAVSFLRKLQVDIPSLDREGVAISSFWASEHQCWDTNRRFERLSMGGSITPSEASALSVLERGKRWLARVLGPLPQRLDSCRFGPGSTSELGGPANTIPDKLAHPMAITSSARDLLPLAYETRLLGSRGKQRDPLTVRGNRFTTVPKDAKKDRGICIEPGVNLWFQLGVGAELRDRLRTIGIDLAESQPIHRQWAQQASHDGLKATIDLSNASDTVAKELVRWLMPPDWFVLLDSLRSHFTCLGGKWIRLEKFSSMGNGFTFELETLVFMAICHAVRCGRPGKDYRVFGDDIIVGTEHSASVLSVLRFCGFTPNPRKTFSSGWFRESCGGDYFKGVDVRVHKQEVDPCEPADWISLGNGIRSTSSFRGVGFCYTWQHAAWLAALAALPSKIQGLRGPVELGDSVIHDYQYTIDRSRGYGRVRALKPCSASFGLEHWNADVVMAYMIYSSRPSRENHGRVQLPSWPFDDSPQRSKGVIPRGAPKGYKIGWIAYG